jgi:hypothetical protein
MNGLSKTEQSSDSELVLDKSLTIKKALRVMIDNRKYTATVTEEDGSPITTVNVKLLREALSLGYSSTTSLEKLVWGNLISEVFFSKT